MEPIPFGRDVLDKTDVELGKALVAYWLSIMLHMSGIDDDDEEAQNKFACVVIEHTASKDGDSYEAAGIESIFRKACRGEFEAAARMFRDFVKDGDALYLQEELAKIAERLIEGRKKGTWKGVRTKKEEAAQRHKLWVSDARNLLGQGKAPHSIAGVIAMKHEVTERQVRNVLQKFGVLEKRK